MKIKFFSMLLAGAAAFLLFSSSAPSKKNISILIITGGHGFKHDPFYHVFDSLKNITYHTAVQPAANELIASPEVNKYDVLVFYDMPDSITPVQQQAYIDLLNKGKGMIFLHHSLVSYQNWKEFKHIVGGKYYTTISQADGNTKESNYEHDLHVPVKIEKRHPITRGIHDFEILDEVYGDCGILPTVTPLLSTTHPKSMRYVAWVNHYGNSDVVYIQLGHGPEAYRNPNYRRLMQQAIEWSSRQHKH